MTKRSLMIALLSGIFAVVSCNKPEDPTPEPEVKNPSLQVEASIEISGASQSHTIPFTLDNPKEGVSLSAACSSDWIYGITAAESEVTFTVSDNLSFPRTAQMELSYGEDTTAVVGILQKTFEFNSFEISVHDISANGAVVDFIPKAHKDNYFFEVFSKNTVDKYLALDGNSLGETPYGEYLYQDDLAYLKQVASYNGLTLSQTLPRLPQMYKVTSSGEATTMTYSDLTQENSYYAIVYGMDVNGNRTTEICLFSFATEAPKPSNITFQGQVSKVTQTGARLTLTPSNNDEYYYWTFVNETDNALYDAETIQQNMVANIKDYAAAYGVSVSEFLNKGPMIYEAKDEFTMGTTYTIYAWGMEANGNVTTPAQEVLSFRTKENDITDDCKFEVEVLEVESMDVKIKVSPSNPSTRYYIAIIDEKRCNSYNDFQMVQRVINMETSRMENGEYGPGVTWENYSDLFSGEVIKWGRKDLLWSFEPEHFYRIYVFGVNGKGEVTTEIYRKDIETGEAEPSNMTFEVSLNDASYWHIGAFDIVPSNSDDYYLAYLVSTHDLHAYRYADGTLMERELMDKIRDIYEDEISQYVFRGNKTGDRCFYNSWTSDCDYSLLLFGYAGTNTTPIYEFKFHSPAIPFGKADCDINYTYELFNGDDLYAMNSTVWRDARGDCVMKVNITITGEPANYYFGLWPPKENFNSTGGIDHLLILCQNEATTGDNIINKNFGILKPWWNGPGMGDGVFVTNEGEHLNYMPWSITAYAEDENHNYSPLHYEMFIPIKKPAAEVTGPYEKGYSEPYDFWSAPSSSNSNTKTIVFNVPKPEVENTRIEF